MISYSTDDFVTKMAVDIAVSVCGLACAYTSDSEELFFWSSPNFATNSALQHVKTLSFYF